MDAILAKRDELIANDLLIRPQLEEAGKRLSSAGASSEILIRRDKAVALYQEKMNTVLSLLDRLAATPRPTGSILRSLLRELQIALSAHTIPPRPKLNSALANPSVTPPLRRPVLTPSVVPAYAQSPYPAPVPEDVAATPEVPLTLEILDIAAELGRDPIAIHDWVRANIRMEWYDGAMKPATEVLHSKAGNSVDQASLLIALYRAIGIPSRYVQGVVELEISRAQSFMGVDEPDLVLKVLEAAGIPYQEVISGGKVSAVRFSHTWVAAFVSYTNYRGAVLEAGDTWVPLDPSFKLTTVTAGEDLYPVMGIEAPAFRDGYVTNGEVSSPLEVLTRTINGYLSLNRPDLTFGTLLRTTAINAPALRLLPNTLPYQTLAVTGEEAALSDALKHKARFLAKEAGETLMDFTMPLTELSGRRLTLSYEPETAYDQSVVLSFGGLDLTPAYLIHLRPVLKVDGAIVVAGSRGLAMGAPHELTIEITAPWGEEEVTNSLLTGGYTAIALSSPTQSYIAPTEPLPQDTEYEAAQILYDQAAEYQKRWEASETTISQLLRVNLVRPLPSLTLVGLVQEASYLFGVPQSLEFRGAYLDADLRVTTPIPLRNDLEDRVPEFRRLSGMEGSFYEHEVFQERWLVDSVSTLKAMQLCLTTAGCRIETLTSENVVSLLPTLSLPPDIKTDIENAITQGYTVQTVSQEILRNAWRGVGYLVEDPESGAASYLLLGRIAGGMTDEPLGGWVLTDLLAHLQFPNSEAANDDPTAVAALQRVALTADRATVGSPLPSLVTVWAQDADGKPVREVPVTFTLVAGGGRLRTIDPATGESLEGTSVTVTTDALGLAHLTAWIVGARTGDNPTFIGLNATDPYATQVGENILTATAVGRIGTVSLSSPFVAYGLPGPVDHLTKILGDGVVAAVNTAGGSLWVTARDSFENPLSNVPVTFTAQPPQSKDPGVALPTGARSVLLYTSETCPTPYPLIGDPACALVESISLPTGFDGTLVSTLLGNTRGTIYPVTATASGIPPITFTLESLGTLEAGLYHPPILSLGALEKVSAEGLPVNATKVGTEMKTPLTAALFLQQEIFTMEGPYPCVKNGSPTDCFRIVPSGLVTLTSIATGTVDFTLPTAQGSLTPTANLGGGYYQASLTPQVAQRLTVEAIGTATVEVPVVLYDLTDLKNIQAILEDYTTETLPLKTVSHQSGQSVVFDQVTGAAQIIGSVEKEPYTVYGVNLTLTVNPLLTLLNTEGAITYSASDTTFAYTIEPSDYTAALAEVDLYEGGQAIARIVGDKTQGSGSAILDQGSRLEINLTHEAEAILNPGSEVEIKGDQLPWCVGEMEIFDPRTNPLTSVSGGVTDSVTQLLLRLTVGQGCPTLPTLTLGLLDAQDPTSTVKIGDLVDVQGKLLLSLPLTFNAQGVAEVLYQVPDSFVRFGAGQAIEDQDKAQPDRSVQITLNGSAQGLPAIRLKRPPLLLVHGTWGDPDSTWAHFEPIVSGDGGKYIVYRANYSKLPFSNVGSLEQNFVAIPLAINKAIESAAAEGLAATKVDIIAHSLGGLVVREYCRQESLDIPSRDCSQEIRKLITLDTPHLGTEVANWLVEHQLVETFLKLLEKLARAFNLLDAPVFGPALEEQATTSDAIKNLTNFSLTVPMHSIVGKTPDKFPGYAKVLVGMWDDLRFYFNLVPDESFLDPEAISKGYQPIFPPEPPEGDVHRGRNDRLVSMKSQKNGGTSPYSVFENEDHVTVHGDQVKAISSQMVDCIARLLDAQVSDPVWTQGCGP
jgi:transglutaminase-like putative cysteine protease/triacylglycerol esterase/lipase EstA (alpha/beta hydrolase family)